MPVKDLVNAIDAASHDDDAEASSAPVPQDMTHIANGLPYRDFVTVGLLVKHMRLKNTTDIPTLGNPPIVPDCWIYVQDPGYKVGRLQIFNNWSPYLVKDVDDTVWIGLEYFCNEGDDFWNMTDAEATKFAISELTRMRVINGPQDVLDSHRERVKKAYPAYFDTYAQHVRTHRIPRLLRQPLLRRPQRPAPLQQHGPLHGHRHRGRCQHQVRQDLEAERVVREHG